MESSFVLQTVKYHDKSILILDNYIFMSTYSLTRFYSVHRKGGKNRQSAHYSDGVTFVNWLELLECVAASCLVWFWALTCMGVICSHLQNWKDYKDELKVCRNDWAEKFQKPWRNYLDVVL